MPQFLDQNCLRLHPGQQSAVNRLSSSGSSGKALSASSMVEQYQNSGVAGFPHERPLPFHPALNDVQLCSGTCRSIPYRSIANWAVRAIFPSFASPLVGGHTNRPFAKRLLNRQPPCPFRQMILIRSPRQPRKTNRCPVNGTCFNVCSACAASVVNLRSIRHTGC